MECEANLRKAKQAYMVRCEEYDKAKTAACRAEEEGGGATAKSVEKKKRLEEEARNKVFISNCSFCLHVLRNLFVYLPFTLSWSTLCALKRKDRLEANRK